MAAKVAHPESIVETGWLAEHLNDHNVAIVEVEVDVDTEASEHHATTSLRSHPPATTWG